MKHAGIFVMSALSILYIAAILLLRGSDVWGLLGTGNLNELGDFLAGVFTPLAFGWLVYGYLLQSKELRLQREELALARNQLGKQTELLREQLTLDYQESIPHMVIRLVSPGHWWRWIVENKGGHAKDMELWNRTEHRRIIQKKSFPRGESVRFNVLTISSAHIYEVRFISIHSEGFRQGWEINGDKYKEITKGPEWLNGSRES